MAHQLETKLIHAGEPRPRIAGAVNVPIFQSVMFETAGETDYHDIKYIRLNNHPESPRFCTKNWRPWKMPKTQW